MSEAVRMSETLGSFYYMTTWCNIPVDSYQHTEVLSYWPLCLSCLCYVSAKLFDLTPPGWNKQIKCPCKVKADFWIIIQGVKGRSLPFFLKPWKPWNSLSTVLMLWGATLQVVIIAACWECDYTWSLQNYSKNCVQFSFCLLTCVYLCVT